MALRSGPLRIRIGIDGAEGKALAERAAAEGLTLVAWDETADLIAVPPPPGIDARLEGAAARLSRREMEILEYLADGWSNAEIASVLRIGVRTVRFHLEGIYAKLGVARRGEAVREAARMGLVRFDF